MVYRWLLASTRIGRRHDVWASLNRAVGQSDPKPFLSRSGHTRNKEQVSHGMG